jgi:hypothetical protein
VEPNDTHLATLILQVQATMRADIHSATNHLADRLADLKARQIEQNGRVNRHEALLGGLQTRAENYAARLDAVERGDLEAAKAIARLDERSKGTIRSFLASLTPKQKATFWTAALAGGGFLADRGWQIVRFVVSLVANGKGVTQ